MRRQWERIGRAVKEGPADAPPPAYWDEFPSRLESRAGRQGAHARRLRERLRSGWAVAAVLLVGLCVVVYMAAHEARRASEAAGRAAHLAAGTGGVSHLPAVPVVESASTAMDMKLFRELDLTFEGGVKWVATDGHRIDFGVSQELGPAPAVAEGPDRVAVVTISVRRIEGGSMQTADQARIVARPGHRADFTSRAGGLEFNYVCLPLIRSGSAARLRLTVGVGKADGDGYGAASADVSLRSGQSAEVARVVSGGATYAIEATLRVLTVKANSAARGA